MRGRLRTPLIAFSALFLALTSGVAWAANTVSSTDIINGEVKSVDIGTGQVRTPDVAPGNVTGPKLADGAVTNAKLADGAVVGAKVLDNSLTGSDIANAAITIPKLSFDPATQAELDAVAGAGGGWRLGGNSGTTGSDFLGTTDNLPLELRVNGARALRLEPASDGTNQSPNVIGGSADNSVTAGVYSAVIGGGGRSGPSDPTSANAVTDNLGTVGGGGNNQAGDGNGTSGDRAAATVSGGANNLATGQVATVVGGNANIASGSGATVAGGTNNSAQGDTSFAAGSSARAQNKGSFVWADAAGFSFNSTAQNQFSVRAIGGSRFVSGVGILGSPTSGLEFPAGTSALGALANQPLDLRVDDARALRIIPASDGTNESPNLIGGTSSNSVGAGVYSATIGGGGRGVPSDPTTANRVTDHQGVVGGGANNQAGDDAGTQGDSTLATVAGGGNNIASGEAATVAGGFFNTASGNRATVVGGDANTAQGAFSLAGGSKAQANDPGAFVWADSSGLPFTSTAPNQFNVRATGGTRLVSGTDASGNPVRGLELAAGTSGWSTIANGQPLDLRVNNARGLQIDPASDGTNQSPNVIGGTASNTVTSGVHSATIGGGGRGVPANPATANRVTDHQGVVGGGANNQAGDAAGTVGDRTLATVGGGGNNTAAGEAATVSGGFINVANGSRATVGGGQDNAASGEKATVGGGIGNSATQVGDTVSGGSGNLASGGTATVAGGFLNSAQGQEATVVGGGNNAAAGDVSLAAGWSAQAAHDGAFVWADSSPFFFSSSAKDQFSVRATGGTRFVSAISAGGTPTAGITLAPGAGSWSSLSDEASKTAIEPVSGRSVLRVLASVPISKWSYRSQDESIRHIGPMAQDFYRAFGVGESRRRISSVDGDGVALAAIKGLFQRLRTERHRRQAQERRLDRLEARLAALEDGARDR